MQNSKKSKGVVKATPKPKAKLTFVTPDMAKQLLKLNTQNRTVSQATVNKYAKLIKEGKFYVTNNGIGIDYDDVLTDGQHRLLAIVKANQGIFMWVMTDLEPKTRLTIDTQKNRTHANSIDMYNLSRIEGDKKNYSKLFSSVSAYIILHSTNRFKYVQAFGNHLTNDDVVSFVEKNFNELSSSVKTVLSLKNESSKTYVIDSHAFFIFQMHKLFNQDKITDFINIIFGNKISDNPDTCPATKLKNALMLNSVKKFGTKFKTKDLLGLWIDASNKFMADEQMKSKSKLIGRPNSAELINVKFSGELNEKAVEFFNSAKILTTEAV